jgi:hypothetical protein
MFSMNLRHAAALALVGWYLMIAAARWDGSKWIEPSFTSLAQWQQVDVFDSAAKCQAAKNQHLDDAIAKDLKRMTHPEKDSIETGLAPDYLCVASDDPRLKVK